MPINADIGQIIEPQPASIEAYAQQALGQPYSMDWLQRYVPLSLQAGFVYTHDETLGTILGSTGIQMAKATQRTHLWEVPFCIVGDVYWWGIMIWAEQGPDGWVLLSLSVEQDDQGK